MSDKYIEKFRMLNTFTAAYLRDVTRPIGHGIRPMSRSQEFIGRAFTVKGAGIYMNALEVAVPEGSVYVQAHTDDVYAVWHFFFNGRYAQSRGIVAVVIDGGTGGANDLAESDFPVFASFVSPAPAINQKEGPINVPIVCGGVAVEPGDILIGDADGVVVIPQCTQDDVYEHVDGFVSGHDLFVKIATTTPDIVMTEHEALGEMFELKYQHPYDYWRYYEPWAAKWHGKYRFDT